MTMLPDIDENAYDEYQRQQLQQDFASKQASFNLQHSMNSRMAEISALTATPSSDSLTNPLGTGNALPTPEPAAPEAPPAQPTEPPVSAVPSDASPPLPPAPPTPDVAPVAPAPAPVPSPTPSAPSAPSTSSTSQQDWIGAALTTVRDHGGDLQKFASALNPGASDLIGSTLGAARAAGLSDLQAFADSLPPLPKPPAPAPELGPGRASTPSDAAPLPQGDFVDYARAQARRYGVDEDIFVRQIQQESGFNPKARSGAGATGIAQFMPGTARGMGVDPSDPYQSLDGAARLMASHLKDYNGDYAKALAAYNAGPGNVAKYGGVPPFEETQNYVKRILGGAGDKLIQGGQAIGGPVGSATSAAGRKLSDISQFGDPQLTNDEAYAACGPAAAVRFASMYGRNPSLREATDLARTVGWTAGGGMAGLSSEKALMDKLGVATKMVGGAQWDQFAREAQSGNPVTISTPGHYFFADGYDPTSGAFHVGRSGTDLKGGSEWMTPAQMQARMGAVQGGLLADNPQVPAPSTADRETDPASYLDRKRSAIASSFESGAPALTDMSGRLTSAATGRPDDLYMGTMQPADVTQPSTPTAPEQPQQSPVDRLKSAFGDFIDSVGGTAKGATDALGSAAGNLVAAPGGPTPGASQPTPSDSLTNPLGYNQLPKSDVLPNIESAIADNQANPPLKGLADEIAKQPLRVPLPGGLDWTPPGAPNIGDVARMSRGPALLSQDELLQTPEAQAARQIFTKNGDTPSDEAVAEYVRAMLTVQAVASTHVGPGNLPPSALARRAPRAGEGAVPASGANILDSALRDLERYPTELSQQVRDWALSADAPSSTVGTTIRRWMEDNPLATSPIAKSREVAAASADDVVRSLDAEVKGGGRGGFMPSGEQPGQQSLGTDFAPESPLLPEGAGSFTPEMLLPGYVPKNEIEARKVAEIRAGIDAARAARIARGEPEVPTTGLQQTESPLGTETRAQPLLSEGEGTFTPEMLLPDYMPKSEIEAKRIAEIKAGIEDARARRAAAGVEDVPTTGLQESDLPGFVPENLTLPPRVPQNVADLIQQANQRVSVRSEPIDMEALAQKGGTTVERIQKVWKPDAQPANQDTLRAVSRAIDDSSSELARLGKAVQDNPQDKDAAAALVKQLTRHQALQEVLEAKPPTAGEALKRLAPNSIAAHAEAMNQLEAMAARFKQKNGEELLNHFAKLDWSDPEVVNSVARVARNFTFGDKAAAAWYFAMLSDPLTHIKNTLGNTVGGVTRPAETAGSALFDPLSRRLLGESGPRQRYFGEVPAEVRGTLASIDKAVPQAWGALKEGWVPERTGDIQAFTREPFRGTPGEFMAYPGRALSAEDTIFRTLNEGASKYGLAYREASKLGLKGQELDDMVAKLIKSPSDDMLEAMKSDASYRVFQNQDRFAQWLNQGRDKYPFLRFLMPFTTTPINIAKYVGERSPLGFAKLGQEAATSGGRAALREAGSGTLSDRLSRATLGTVTWGWLVKQGMDGNITGAAPTDPTEKDAFYRQGKQPYSLRNPATGEWTSYQALTPYSMLFSSAADVSQAIKDQRLKDPNDMSSILWSTGAAIGHSMVNQQWTQGLQDFMDAWDNTQGDPGKTLQRWSDKQVGNMVVPGVIRSVTRATDDVIRDPHNAWEQVASNLPNLSGVGGPNLPDYVAPQLDAMGNVRRRPSSGAEALVNPMPGVSESVDPVEAELKRLQGLKYNVEPGRTGGQVTVAGEPVDLNDSQQWSYQRRSGSAAHTALSMVVGTPDWNQLSDDEKAQFVNDTFSDARKLSRQDLEPELIRKAVSSLSEKRRLRGDATGAQAAAG